MARASPTTQEKQRRPGGEAGRDTIWAFVQTLTMRLVANVAVDTTWSALRIEALQSSST